MSDSCPTCGREVRVVTDGGTSHYEPVQPEELTEEHQSELLAILDAIAAGNDPTPDADQDVVGDLRALFIEARLDRQDPAGLTWEESRVVHAALEGYEVDAAVYQVAKQKLVRLARLREENG